MDISEIPDKLRVKLSSEDQQLLWKKVQQKGVTDTAEMTGFERQKIYSWKSKDLFIPVSFVREFLDNPGIEAVKAGGRSSELKNISVEFENLDELLTRFSESVYVNEEGVPFYRSDEYSLVRRFRTLLESFAEMTTSVYRRSFYELRFPKTAQVILSELDYQPVQAARIDESGEIQNGVIELDGTEIPVSEFSGKLYSEEKKMQLALERKDDDELEKIIADQTSKANSLL